MPLILGELCLYSIRVLPQGKRESEAQVIYYFAVAHSRLDAVQAFDRFNATGEYQVELVTSYADEQKAEEAFRQQLHRSYLSQSMRLNGLKHAEVVDFLGEVSSCEMLANNRYDAGEQSIFQYLIGMIEATVKNIRSKLFNFGVSFEAGIVLEYMDKELSEEEAALVHRRTQINEE